MTDSTDALDDDIAKMTKIAKIVKQFDNTEIQTQVFDTLLARAFGKSDQSPKREPTNEADVTESEEPGSAGSATVRKAPAKKAPAKKAGNKKLTYSATKDINFAPTSKVSWKAFAEQKAPTNLHEKALLAVYYMRETLKRKVTTGDVIAAFNVMGWRNPANPANNLQVAAHKGWLDTSDMNDIKTVWHGENLVEHDLPKAAKPTK
ncbi:hypothetical protein [Mycobacteroides abscessus]|uniref:hypothetical protein n=1 Tax=Mycobacteroides abscessus TaxID=36809 RepID=UPI0006690FB1|nr:hypothetical protein [Mycobacteroides abscessus]AKP57680.1 hypothetical protein MAUC22_08520 [Mycobacteroides abscessus UC22]MDO3102981.1 hypothetical protein [Mycobacteroides abscessus subsp. abscessus]NOS01280.1 hypothetical protein [Mycobacteroides abscessus]PVA20150.1 hypothetical protein DDJ52_12645 [Mycobacteroides abscessus]RIQ98196.1 hypothetical protein D2E35_17805 [Mycobacteroides abscessus]